MKNSPLIKIFLAIFLAILAGMASSKQQGFLGVTFVQLYDLVGKLFLNALMLVVVPLVAASIITGVARMGNDESMGSLGAKTLFYFILTTSIAVLVGYVAVTLMAPGAAQMQVPLMDLDNSQFKAIEQVSEEGGFAKIEQLLLKVIPSNILAAASQGQMLGVIVFCFAFGYFLTKIESELASTMLSFWNALFQITMKMTQFVMRSLPIGVFALVAKVVATSGLDSFKSVAWFFVTVLVALGFYAFIVLPLLLKCIAKVSPIAHFKAMAPALLTAFSTSSSAGSLPVVIDCVEKRAGISNRICSFTIPLGTSVNLAGSALYECVVVFFIAQVYGVSLSFATQCLIIVMSILTSFGIGGIPSACLVAIVVILQTVGLPAEAIGLVFAVERILDMFRTTTNVFSNTCCAVLVASSEEKSNLQIPIKADMKV